MIRILLTITLLFLSACSSSPEQELPLTTQINAKDPTNAQLKQAIHTYLSVHNLPVASQFQFNRYDLNGDGLREGLVLMQSPFGYWCNMNGCPLFIFKANKNGFTFLNKIKPIRAPVYISTTKTSGWHDIVTRVSGRMNEKAKNVTLKYEGRAYPNNPEGHPNTRATFIGNPQYIRVFN